MTLLALLLLACAENTPKEGEPDPSPDSAAPDTGEADTAEGDTADSAAPLSGTATALVNPYNPMSAIVTVTLSQDAQVVVAYGEGALTHSTPAVSVAADEPTEIVVLGLRADRTFTLQARSGEGEARWESEALMLSTAPLPALWPVCTPTFFADEAEFDADEVICTNGSMSDGTTMYMCLDRWGEPVLSLSTEENDSLMSMRPLRSGGWAVSSLTTSKVALFDQRGAQIARYGPSWLADQTRFTHEFMDSHEIYEIPSGRWAGAIAFFTSTYEWHEDGTFQIGNGLVVMDPATEEILYDYSFHGEVGDGEPMDPLVPYTRSGHGDYAQDWTHANTLLHHADPDGREYFLVSLKAQDWIVKLYPDTDEIAWRLGFEGDFALVDDLDAASPAAVSPLDWFYQQHGMVFVAHEGSRTRLLLFDNGFPRNDGDGYDLMLAYSRILEIAYDEDTLQASVVFAYGEPSGDEDPPLFSDTCGNAELLPGEAAVMAMEGQTDRALEVSYPDGEPRWEMTCESVEWCSYRAQYYPDLYTLAWDDR